MLVLKLNHMLVKWVTVVPITNMDLLFNFDSNTFRFENRLPVPEHRN